MNKSTETIDCNGEQVPAWFVDENIRWSFDRPAMKEKGGGISMAQLRDDEMLIAPGAIYRQAPHI